MMELVPKNIFTWNFDVYQEGNWIAEIKSAMLREAAEVEVNGISCTFRREKGFGAFILESGGKRLVEARKPSALKERFDIAIGDRCYILQRVSWLTRAFVLERNGEEVGSIRPQSWLARRADVELPEVFPDGVKVFVTWLVLLMWKRQAAAAAGG